MLLDSSSTLTMSKFYAVAVGQKTGIYNSWPECQAQTDGFSGAVFKKFKTLAEAEDFLAKYKMNEKQKSKTMAVKHSKASSTNMQNKNSSSSNSNSKSTSLLSSINHTWKAAGTKRSYDDTKIVYTDGACINNGKHNAAAGIGVFWSENDCLSEPLTGKPTNNRAEIQAVVKALQQAKDRGYYSVTVRTDSAFLLNSITSWVPKWIEKNWILSTGGAVKNKEDFLDLLEAMQGLDVHWEKVDAHCGVYGNERADKLAREGIRKRRRL